MTKHVCNRRSAWPIGHPLPPENPDRLAGPKVGARVLYHDPKHPTWDGIEMRVTARSYVWSPGECRSNGGYRHYDWSVVEWDAGNGRSGSMVVDDDKLEEIG